MLKRSDLPITVRDEVWNLIEEVQKIEPLQYATDLTRRNGRVSPNVEAQFWTHLGNLKIGILAYVNNPSEELIAHEVVHAWRAVKGYPKIWPREGREIVAGLDNFLQHPHINQVLEKIGFEPLLEAKKKWGEGIKLQHEDRDKIIAGMSERNLMLLGVTTALEGLIAGLDSKQVRKDILPEFGPGVVQAVEIHGKLKKANLNNVEEDFDVRLKIAKILELTGEDATIKIFDFKARAVHTYDILSGEEINQ